MEKFIGERQKCQYCGYIWISRVAKPVSCPRCKRRIDYNRKNPKSNL